MKKILPTIAFVLALFSGAVFAESVNINTADAATISRNLSGIGLKKAEAIVDYRNQHGPFQSADDLEKVNGIGRKLVDVNRHKITVGSPPAPPAM